jgi:pseudaminic acid cytidylyltransferase
MSRKGRFKINICIIPARGGSKRIKRKNIKSFHGKPIISYSIEACLKSKLFDFVIVSTDDPEIANIAVSCGASVPFLRPQNLSDDFTSTLDVVKHAISFIKTTKNLIIDNVCVVYPCAPFIDNSDLIKSFDIFRNSKLDFCFAAGLLDYPLERLMCLNKKDELVKINTDYFDNRTQDLNSFFFDAGQFYWANIEYWSNTLELFEKNSIPYFFEKTRLVDIDTNEDWSWAELLFEALKLKNEK